MTLTTLCLGLLSAYLVGIVLFWRVWRPHSVDLVRDELFRLRDELFAFTADPNTDLDFEDAVYGMLRLHLNAHIRVSDKVSLRWLLEVSKVEPPKQHTPWHERFAPLLNECTPEVQARLQFIHGKSILATLLHARRTSLICIVLGGWWTITRRHERLKKSEESAKRSIERGAEAYEEINPDGVGADLAPAVV